VNVHEKSLTLPGGTICSAGTTEKEFDSVPSGPRSILKNALTESKKESSAAEDFDVTNVSRRVPMITANARRLAAVVNRTAD
jgi:hypothetical protein